MKKTVLYTTIVFTSGLIFTNIYNSIVNAANWESNIPQSITATRDFFVIANPGTFFQLVDPANLLLTILALVLFWKSSSIRLLMGIALLCHLASFVLTFSYFYPRNEILFLSEPLPGREILENAAREWGRMNWVRTSIWVVALVCTFRALDKVFSGKSEKTDATAALQKKEKEYAIS